MTAMAAILSAALLSSCARTIAARASLIAFFTRGVAFGGERLVERRQHARVARLEHRLRRVERRLGSGAISVRPPTAASTHAAQPVVEAHVVEIVGGCALGRLAGRGIEQLAVLGLDEDLLVLGGEQQPRILQRLDHRRGQRIAARGHGVDRVGGVAEIVGGKAGERVFVGAGMGKAGACRQQAESKYERYDAAVKNTHCNRSRHLLRQVWRRRASPPPPDCSR